jgi:pimeloyl-ACP methyl ester carboxylesterase
MAPRRVRRALGALVAAFALVAGTAACEPPPEFYQPPATLPARAGDVIRSVETNFGLNGNVTSTAIMYRSTNARGQANAVTGTLLVPKSAWTGSGPRPVIAYAVGTQGVGDNCAPSKSIARDGSYESGNLQLLLDQGWAVAVTDYEGLGTPGDHTYIVRAAEGHAVLDMVRAAQRLPGSGVAANAPVGIWGYSQGGQAAAAAAELEASYAPELDVRGTVAGGVPSNLEGVAANLNGPNNFFFTFLAFAALGLDTAYPELDLESYLNDAGRNLFNSGRNACLVDGLLLGTGQRIENLTTSNPLNTPQWQARVREQALGTVRPAAPALLYHGQQDQVIPYDQGTGLRDSWCSRGARVRFVTTQTDHIGGFGSLNTEGTAFMRSLLTGQPVATTCN